MPISESLKVWQDHRNAELTSPDSWLGLIGLFWLQPGINPVGGDVNAIVRLPCGPAVLGYLFWGDGTLLWRPEHGEPQALATDRSGTPTIVDFENLSFFVVDREGQLAVRLRDRNWANRRNVPPLSYFAFDPAWIVEANWLAIEPPLVMEVPNVSGELKPVTVAFKAVFDVAGESISLLPMSVGKEEVFFVFRDRTSGKDSYGAGRFLKVPAAVDGKIWLDFNRAYNPPCAFTSFATCPLPPPENWLPFAVPAGERKWQDHP